VDGTVIAASGRNGRWLSRLLSPDRAALGETPDRCAAAGLGLSVERVFGLDEGRYGLTGEQGSVLRMAFERGYYAIPRETAVQDLASEMWVSPHQALSERLHRAHATMLGNTVMLGHDGGGGECRR